MATQCLKTCMLVLALCTLFSFLYFKQDDIIIQYYFQPDSSRISIGLTQEDFLKQSLYFDRQDQVEKACHAYRQRRRAHKMPSDIFNDTEVMEHILVDIKHKLLYCYVPKVACTNWKRTLLFLSGQTYAKDPSSIDSNLVHRSGVFPKLTHFSRRKALHILHNYTKFLIVRHPLERILSAYHNKFQQKYDSSKYFQKRFGRHIIKKYRKNPSNHSLEFGDDVTFPEFVAYLTTEVSRNRTKYNEHWKPIHELCAPCSVHYDIIARYETLEDDAAFLLRLLGESPKTFTFHPSPTASKLDNYVSTLSARSINALYKMYEEDFQLFNYDLKGFAGLHME